MSHSIYSHVSFLPLCLARSRTQHTPIHRVYVWVCVRAHVPQGVCIACADE